MFHSEQAANVFVLKPADHAAGVAGDSINTGKVSKIVYYVQSGAITGNAVLTVKSGASAGTQTTAETFRYRLADADQAAAGSDLYGDWATSSSLTMTAATYDNKVLIVEVDDDTLTADQPWATLALSSAASALNVSVVAVCSPRYQANDSVTVIA
jgi:hypothetical protein